MTSLKHLLLDQCDFYGTIPTELGELKKLNRLFFYGTEITGTVSQYNDHAGIDRSIANHGRILLTTQLSFLFLDSHRTWQHGCNVGTGT